MDCDVVAYKMERFEEIKHEMQNMLVKVGWKKMFVEKCIPILPISGWHGDNLLLPSQNMPWWQGCEVAARPKDPSITVVTLLDALDKAVTVPERNPHAPLRMPVASVYKIQGVGDVIAGRIEQGSVKPTDVVVFVPSHTKTKECRGKVFSIEMHHHVSTIAGPGDNVGINVKNLVKENMPRPGDCMILAGDETLKPCKKFVTQVQVLDHPGELKAGYCPIAFVRTARSACRMTHINWKIGKDSQGTKEENPGSLRANEMAEIVLEPLQPFVCTPFEVCEGMGRVALMDGGSVIMLGRVVAVEFQDR